MDNSTLEIGDAIFIASSYTKTSSARLKAMAAALLKIERDEIQGDIVECGVWRGGNIILARKLAPGRVCWLYDTFEGMTLPQDIDVSRSGKKAIESYRGRKKPGGKWAAVTVDDVRANLAETGTLDDRQLRFVKGPVESTLLDLGNLPERIAILRLDTDWHASTKMELEVLYPLLSEGGVLIVDDYGHWRGARKAVDDYFGGALALEMIDYTAAMAVK
jgi:O-methyltransferase